MNISETRIPKPRCAANANRATEMRDGLIFLRRFLHLRKEEPGKHTHREEGEALKAATTLFPELKTLTEEDFGDAAELCRAAITEQCNVSFNVSDWENYRERRRQTTRKRVRAAQKRFEEHLEAVRHRFPVLAEAICQAAFEPDPRWPAKPQEERPDPVRQALYRGPVRLRMLAMRAELAGSDAAWKAMNKAMQLPAGTKRNLPQTSYDAKEAARRQVYADADEPYPGASPAPAVRF